MSEYYLGHIYYSAPEIDSEHLDLYGTYLINTDTIEQATKKLQTQLEKVKSQFFKEYPNMKFEISVEPPL